MKLQNQHIPLLRVHQFPHTAQQQVKHDVWDFYQFAQL